jgi:hypothetical protein
MRFIETSKIWMVTLFLTGALLQNAFADMGELALGVGPGTLGIGADVTVGILPQLNARIGVNAFNFDMKTTQDDIDYDLDIRLLSFPVLLDWYPFRSSGFRLSAGLAINKNKADLDARPQADYEIGGSPYPANEVGNLSGKLKFDTLAPYVGLGWGNALGENSRWTFTCDLGVIFHGNGDISLKADGPIASDATFQAALEKERRDLEDEIDDYRYYPVMAIGLSYKF